MGKTWPSILTGLYRTFCRTFKQARPRGFAPGGRACLPAAWAAVVLAAVMVLSGCTAVTPPGAAETATLQPAASAGSGDEAVCSKPATCGYKTPATVRLTALAENELVAPTATATAEAWCSKPATCGYKTPAAVRLTQMAPSVVDGRAAATTTPATLTITPSPTPAATRSRFPGLPAVLRPGQCCQPVRAPLGLHHNPCVCGPF
jgi:hypothetical protein